MTGRYSKFGIARVSGIRFKDWIQTVTDNQYIDKYPCHLRRLLNLRKIERYLKKTIKFIRAKNDPMWVI